MEGIGKKYRDVILQIVESSIEAIRNLGPQALEHREANKKWNKRQILGHLIDSSYHNLLRFMKGIQNETMDFDDYEQDFCVDANQYQFRSNTEVVETFVVFQRQIATLLGGISDEVFLKKHKVENGNPIDCLSHFAFDYINHLEHHLAQLIPNYNRQAPSEFYR